MGAVALAILYAVFVWWFSTGLILMLVRMRRELHAAGFIAASALAVLALIGLYATRDNATPAGAYAGFTYGIIAWAWLEISFLYGYVVGPRRMAAPAGLVGMARFRAAFAAISHHEIAIVLGGLAVAAVSIGADNWIGAATYGVLWIMRISAKLNVFFGAPNVSTEFLPRHLSYLGSYFNRGPIRLFFPVSVSLASLGFAALVHSAASTSDPFDVIGTTLIATLLGLAIIEHWFLVLPVRDAALWRWALKGDTGKVVFEKTAETRAVALPRSASKFPL